MGVILISDATLPSMSVMVVFAGMRNSNPGNNGVVTTTSLAVGNGTLTAWARIQRRHPDGVVQHRGLPCRHIHAHFEDAVDAVGPIGGPSIDHQFVMSGRNSCQQESPSPVGLGGLVVDVQGDVLQSAAVERRRPAGQGRHARGRL